MRASNYVLCSLLASVLGLGLPPALQTSNRARSRARLVAKVTPSDLPRSGNASRITAFDVKPDGGRLALLYVTWPSPTTYELSVAIWDGRSQSVVQHVQIGVHGFLPTSSPLIDNEVAFTANGKYLLVLGLGKIWIISASTCTVVSSIDSPRSDMGPPVHLLHVRGSRFAAIYKWRHNKFYACVFEIPDGKLEASWSSSAFPQSFSPDGKLVVGPVATYNAGGVTNLQLMDSQTGVELKSIPTVFGFQRRSPEQKGSVTAQFLDNKHIVVTPDDTVDAAGHHSGNSLEIINVSESRDIRRITPKNFGPTGELFVSPDFTHFVVYSSFTSAWAKRWDGLWPDFHKPELLIFKSDASKPESVIPLGSRDGALAHLRNLVLPRLSSNASVVAAAQRGAVEIFRVTE